LDKALRLLPVECAPDGRTVVLAGEAWHRGVLGLVASRVAEAARKPAVLFSLEGPFAIGSGRSAAGFNLFEALEATRGLCESLGGHAEAAGLKLKRERLPRFREAFEESASLQPLPPEDDEALIDFEASFGDLWVLKDAFQGLEPFGQGNPPPVAVIRNVRVADAVPARSGGDRHALFRVFLGPEPASLVGFDMAPRLPEAGPVLDFLAVFDNNRFSQKLPGWRLLDFKAPGASTPPGRPS
jgi:single-stranded-DNA-specific exonuclease